VITLVNGLHFWIPTLPSIPVKRQDLRYLFETPPWSAVRIGSVFWSTYPFAVGLSFLVPLDLSFSIWVFFLLHKLQLVAAHAAGYAGTQVPYSNQQSIGAYLAILCGALWMGRGSFRLLLAEAFSRNAGPEARAERWAVLGLGSGLVLLYAFLLGVGLSPAIAAAFLGLYLALIVMITRIRAELGFPVHDLAGVGPHHTLVALLGTPAIGANSLAGFGLLYAFVRRFTSHPMPHHLEALKMGDLTGASPRAISSAGLIAAAVGIAVGFWLFLDRYYAIGAESAYWNGWTWWLGREAMNTASNWVSNPTPAEPGALVATGAGFAFALFLNLLRLRLARFPFHPLAYAVAPSWGIANLWSCVLIAWLAKAVILRWAGLKGYRRAVPFFLGLVLGEFVCGAGWTLAGILLDQPSYDFWP
ncbi:MAG: hypothetical protein QHJ73_10615, partial [Armatimonadota bacterium]|nr:hypothetical protein [Armatimonadota bacterium]